MLRAGRRWSAGDKARGCVDRQPGGQANHAIGGRARRGDLQAERLPVRAGCLIAVRYDRPRRARVAEIPANVGERQHAATEVGLEEADPHCRRALKVIAGTNVCRRRDDRNIVWCDGAPGAEKISNQITGGVVHADDAQPGIRRHVAGFHISLVDRVPARRRDHRVRAEVHMIEIKLRPTVCESQL